MAAASGGGGAGRVRRQSGARHTEDLLRLPARCGGGQDTLRPPSRYGPAQPPPRAQRRAPPRAASAAVAARPRQSRIQSMPCRRIFAESRSGRGPVEAFPMPSCCSSIVLAAAGHFHVHRTLASEGRRGAASWCPAACRWGRGRCAVTCVVPQAWTCSRGRASASSKPRLAPSAKKHQPVGIEQNTCRRQGLVWG